MLLRYSQVFALGDSLTYGAGADMGSDYPTQLASITGATVQNLGYPSMLMQSWATPFGSGYITNYSPLQGCPPALTIPSLITAAAGKKCAFVLEFGTNDSKGVGPNSGNWVTNSPTLFVSAYQAMLSWLQGLATASSISADFYLILPPYVDASNPYLIQPTLLRNTISPLIQGVASTQGCKLIDLWPATQANYPQWYSAALSDGTHLGDAGYASMAQFVALALSATLAPTCGMRGRKQISA